MKKNKFLALFLALAVIFSLALPIAAFAAPALGTDGKIVINPPNGHSLPLDKFEAYELFTLIGTSEVEESAQFAYEPTPSVVAFLADVNMANKYGAENLTGTAAAEAFRQWLQNTSRIESELVELAKDLTNNVSVLEAVNSANLTKHDGSIVFSNLNYGYYLVTGETTVGESNSSHSENIISRSMLVAVPGTDASATATVNLKVDVPSIEKEVWHHDFQGTGNSYNGTDKPEGGSAIGWNEFTDVHIGQDVYFKLESPVPDMTGYDTYSYIIHDTLSQGITYDHSKSEMKIQLIGDNNNTEPLSEYSDYTVSISPATDEEDPSEYIDGTKIEITFSDFEKWSKNAGWAVEVIYKATLNEKALIGNPGNPNKVILEYSNNPNWDGKGDVPTGKTPEDDARVFTFDLEIFKYTGKLDGNETPLKDAEFQLQNALNKEVLYVIPDTDNGYDYRVASKEELNADLNLPEAERQSTTTLVSGSDGKIKIKGLDEGRYELKETKAPTGYNLLPDMITDIVIEKDESADGYSLKIAGEPQQSINVLNNTGGELPGTGGIGSYIFFGVGGILAIILITAFVIHRKKKLLNTLDSE